MGGSLSCMSLAAIGVKSMRFIKVFVVILVSRG